MFQGIVSNTTTVPLLGRQFLNDPFSFFWLFKTVLMVCCVRSAEKEKKEVCDVFFGESDG